MACIFSSVAFVGVGLLGLVCAFDAAAASDASVAVSYTHLTLPTNSRV